MNILQILNRSNNLFDEDLTMHKDEIEEIIRNSTFLVLGGAGSIGREVAKEIYIRNPKALHIVDINENELVETVRDIRSSSADIQGDFKSFVIDIGDEVFEKYFEQQLSFDYILNLTALKHVRSEKDPYTLLRMLKVNVINSRKLFDLASCNSKKYFCVSTDKAANPVSLMGASKKLMEDFLCSTMNEIPFSSARFANVAFSNGSLLQGFQKRIEKKQPIACPNDVERYFMTPAESGQLCLLSSLLGKNREVFFPKINKEFKLVKIQEILFNFLKHHKLEPYLCSSEDEARSYFANNHETNLWPCFLMQSDTSGEKPYEEFFGSSETLKLDQFSSIGIVALNEQALDYNNFINDVSAFECSANLQKKDLVEIFYRYSNNLKHISRDKNLDEKM